MPGIPILRFTGFNGGTSNGGTQMSDFRKFVRWVKDMRQENELPAIRTFYNKIKAREPERCNDITKVIGFCPGCDKAMVDGEFSISARGLERPDYCCPANEQRYISPRRRAFDELYCKECCDVHMECQRCGDRVRRDESCGECSNGNCCCRCVSCDACGEHYSSSDSVCGECLRGYDCCECSCEGREEHSNVQFFDSELKFHNSNKMQYKQNRSKRYVAAEIEVASMDGDYAYELVKTIKSWNGSVVHDGSLPSSGFEINTAPANGDQFVKEITEICDRLSRGDATVNSSCGLHVHVDARDYDFYTLKNLIRVYAAIENTLYNLVPVERKKSSYCIPCGEKYMAMISNSTKNHKDEVRYAVIRATYNILNAKDKKLNKYDGARYNALNLHSFFFRKTIECRMFSGTVRKEDIINWGKLWAYILDYAKQHTWKDIERHLPMTMPTLYNTSAALGVQNLLVIADGDSVVKKFILDRIAMFGDNNHRAVVKQLSAVNQAA